jgi:hypothetical protein
MSRCFLLWSLALLVRAPAVRADDIDDLAGRVDRLIEQRLLAETVTAAPVAGDAEFLRRVYLDLGGRIPPASRVRQFLAETAADKRRRVVDELLDSSLYVMHFSTVWRKALLPETQSDPQTGVLVPGFEAWLRQKLSEDTSYSAMVREIVTVSLAPAGVAGELSRPGNRPSPLAFYQAKQIKPENLAASMSRTFLGIRIECAQCHDHPFDKWKQDEFWSFAAFFAGMERQGQGGFLAAIREVSERRELEIPGTGRSVGPVHLDGAKFGPARGGGTRRLLADWMISDRNPYFARAAVNRLWAHQFGIGLVDPPDDFTADNPPSHARVLELLATEFVVHGFDVRFILRAIAATKAYQRTSRRTHPSQSNLRLFSRMAVRGLSPEQIYDSLAQAVGHVPPPSDRQPAVPGQSETPRSRVLELFRDESSRPTQKRTTILQALALMNSDFTADATSVDRSRTLAAVAGIPGLTTGDRIEALYLVTLGRRPRVEELKRLAGYVDGGGATGDRRQALGDIFWALLNSSEFLLNH